jgi:virulence-associated protein VagC
MKKNQHVVPHGNQWAVKGEKNDKATKVVETQSEAIRIAREIAINQQSEVVIHRPTDKLEVRIPMEMMITHQWAKTINEIRERH